MTMQSVSLVYALSKVGWLSIQRKTLIIADHELSINRQPRQLGANREARMWSCYGSE